MIAVQDLRTAFEDNHEQIKEMFEALLQNLEDAWPHISRRIVGNAIDRVEKLEGQVDIVFTQLNNLCVQQIGRLQEGCNDVRKANAGLQRKNDELQRANDELQEENDELQGEVGYLRKSNAGLQRENDELQREVGFLRKAKDQFKKENFELQRKSDQLQSDCTGLYENFDKEVRHAARARAAEHQNRQNEDIFRAARENGQVIAGLNEELHRYKVKHSDAQRSLEQARNDYQQEIISNESKEVEIKQLQQELQSLRPQIRPDTPPDDRSINEILVAQVIAVANEAFDAQDYDTARAQFEKAESRLDPRDEAHQKLLTQSDIKYRRAISQAYVVDINDAKQALQTFLDDLPQQLDRELKLQYAHVQHLLAQIYIGLGQLEDASKSAEEAERIRRRMLGKDSGQRLETLALIHRIRQLQESPDVENLSQMLASRDTYRKDYEVLCSLPQDPQAESPGMSGFRPSRKIPQLLPLHLMRRKRSQPSFASDGVSPPPSLTSLSIDDNSKPLAPGITKEVIKFREELMKELKLKEPSKGPSKGRSKLPARLVKAIIESDADGVRGALHDLHTSRNQVHTLIPALHMAALCGNTAVAQLLINAKAQVTDTCSTSAANGRTCNGVTPMHLAAAARDLPMMSLLHRHGATLARATKGDIAAPPLWAINRRWVRRFPVQQAQDLIEALQHMQSLGWNPKDAVNISGESVEDLVPRALKEWPKLRDAVSDFLESPGSLPD